MFEKVLLWACKKLSTDAGDNYVNSQKNASVIFFKTVY